MNNTTSINKKLTNQYGKLFHTYVSSLTDEEISSMTFNEVFPAEFYENIVRFARDICQNYSYEEIKASLASAELSNKDLALAIKQESGREKNGEITCLPIWTLNQAII